MKIRIYLSSPHMGEEELQNVKEAFATNWISLKGFTVSFSKVEKLNSVWAGVK